MTDDAFPPASAAATDGPLRVLVTGATGYVGGRLVPELLADGHKVRAVARTPERLAEVPWRDQVDVRRADLGDADAIAAALRPAGAEPDARGDVDVLYHLVHSMSAGADFAATELSIATTVARAAAAAGVARIVYLGGIHPEGIELSPHMASRTAVGDALLASGVPTLVLDAGVVIGSGSASFEMIRHLTENLPLMPAPSWVRNRVSPIAVRDVLHYLRGAVRVPREVSGRFDIGSREPLTYAALMHGYRHEAGLGRRRIYSLPIPAPRLAGWWVALVTPVPHAMAVPLVQSLQHDAVCRDTRIDDVVPPPAGGLTPYRVAVRLALAREKRGDVTTTWAGASGGISADPLPSDPGWAGAAVFVDERTRVARDLAPHEVWPIVEGIGGRNGWYSLPVAWAVRGVLDTLVGGPGHARGRRHPDVLAVGDAVDWWRVERLERGRYLRLRAEMRVAGGAWLELLVEPAPEGGTRYRQRAVYLPHGLLGKLYWWVIVPFHALVFPAMVRNVLAAARERRAGRDSGVTSPRRSR